MKLFHIDSPMYRFLSRFYDMLKLNLLWLLFSVPIVTIGAATTAAYQVTLKMAQDQEGYIGRNFLAAFRENWKQGTLLGLFNIICIYAVWLDFQFFEAVPGNPILFLIFGFVAIFIFSLSFLYAYPLSARYQNSTMKTLRNSMEISMRYFGRTLILCIVVIVEAVIFLWNSTTLLIGILIGPACIIFTIASMALSLFTEIERS